MSSARKIAKMVFADQHRRTYFTPGAMHVEVANSDGSMDAESGALVERQLERLILESSGVEMNVQIHIAE